MRGSSQRRLFAGLCLLLIWQAGCAAFRPIQGVPVRSLPEDMKVGDRSNRRTIDLSLLRQSPPIDPATGNVVHRIDGGDVLGVYVEGFVGKSSDPPPVFFPVNNDSPPSFGLPYPVREDGTISLPFVGSVNLRGLTLAEAEERVRQAYLAPRQMIRPDFHRVQVNLQRPRQYRVLVIRQDSRTDPGASGMMGQLNIGAVKRGTGKVVNLPVYSNDVLNALTATDGLPGLDADNAVIVIRGRSKSQGGTLDPRWPTDLDPSLMMRSGTSPERPVIRGQSRDVPGYLHSENVRQATHLGPPRRVQPAGATVSGHGSSPNSPPSSGGFGTDMPLAPPRIWPDRNDLSPTAFDSLSGPGSYPAGSAGPGSFAARSPQGQMPFQPNGPAWNGSPGAPGPSPGNSPRDNPVPIPNPMMSQPAVTWGPQPNGPQAFESQPNEPPPNGLQFNGPQPNGMLPGGPPPGSRTSSPSVNPQPNNRWDRGPNVDQGPDLEAALGLGGGTLDGRHVIRIPIRLGPGETADIRPEDVILYDGDIVFIESRDTEVFYTGGLLGGGQYTLPRDYDLDILQALSLASSRGNSGGNRSIGGVSALNNDVSISPSTAIVLRKLPDGGEIPVKVDLYRARTDLSERIVIQPGDFILLQYTPLEAVGAFFERHLLETAIFGLAAQSFNKTGK